MTGRCWRVPCDGGLKTRGCQDILITVVDGLEGLTEVISMTYSRIPVAPHA